MPSGQSPDLRESIDDAKYRRLQQQAMTARARGDWQAERDALDQLHLMDRAAVEALRLGRSVQTGEQAK